MYNPTKGVLAAEDLLFCNFVAWSPTGCPKKGIDKKLLFGAAQGFNSQFFKLFGFSITVRFVWCII